MPSARITVECQRCGAELKHDKHLCRACGEVPPSSKHTATYQPKRHYQMHPGNNHFFVRGRIITGGDLSVMFITWGALTVTTVVYFAFVAPSLWTRISPALPVLAAWMLLVTYFNLIHASWTDPGIIPRGEKAEVEPDGDVVRLKPIEMLGASYRLKFCNTCEMYRPPRTSHCSRCDNCIERFDHHCPWLGQCVGRRNYRYFFVFVTFITLSCFFVAGTSIALLVLVSKDDTNDFEEAIRLHPASMYCFLICAIFGLITGRLLSFHLYLLTVGLTTNEELCGTYGDGHPFNHGFVANFSELMFGPRLLGRLEPRHRLAEDGAMHNRPLRPAKPPDNDDIPELTADEERQETLRFREMRRYSSRNSVQSGEITEAVDSLVLSALRSEDRTKLGRNHTGASVDTGGYAAVGSVASVSAIDSPDFTVEMGRDVQRDVEQDLDRESVSDHSTVETFVTDVNTLQVQMRKLTLEGPGDSATRTFRRDSLDREDPSDSPPHASSPLLGRGSSKAPAREAESPEAKGPGRALAAAIGEADDGQGKENDGPVVLTLEQGQDDDVTHTEVAV